MSEQLECGQCWNELDVLDANGEGRIDCPFCDTAWYVWEIDSQYKNRADYERQQAQGDE